MSNLYNLRPQKQTDSMKENINRSMLFAEVGNDINKDALLFLHHEGMEHYEDTIDYETLIEYSFMQYSLKRGLK